MATSKNESLLIDAKEKDPVSQVEFLDLEKNVDVIDVAAESSLDEDEEEVHKKPVETARDIVTSIITAEDDPSLSPWTFRTWFLGAVGRFFRSLQLMLVQDLEWQFSVPQPQQSQPSNHSQSIYTWSFLLF
jgi:hypothetical protein